MMRGMLFVLLMGSMTFTAYAADSKKKKLDLSRPAVPAESQSDFEKAMNELPENARKGEGSKKDNGGDCQFAGGRSYPINGAEDFERCHREGGVVSASAGISSDGKPVAPSKMQIDPPKTSPNGR